MIGWVVNVIIVDPWAMNKYLLNSVSSKSTGKAVIVFTLFQPLAADELSRNIFSACLFYEVYHSQPWAENLPSLCMLHKFQTPLLIHADDVPTRQGRYTGSCLQHQG